MATTDQTEAERAFQRPAPGGPLRVLKRYGPFVAVALVVVGAIAVFGGGGDDTEDTPEAAPVQTDEDALIRSGPMTPAKARLLGEQVDFGPGCDPATEKLMLPTLMAPPCVQPFTGDNGGATSPGVTAEEILVIRYEPNPDQDLQLTAMLESGGAEIDPAAMAEAMDNYVRLYNERFETYGRTVKLETFTATSNTPEGQQADAIAIADRQPFAVLAGSVSESFARELHARGIVCAPGCMNGYPDSVMQDIQPHIWQFTPTANQLVALTAEMIANVAPPDAKAEHAGSDELRQQDRVYGVLHYNTADGTHTEAWEELQQQLPERGIDIAADSEFTLDIPRAQETARTIIAQLEEAQVTTVIYYGDPVMPKFFTEEATRQDYFPEWIIGPNVGLDTNYAGRLMDQQQWANAFGMALLPTRGPKVSSDPIHIYEWAFGEPPPTDLVQIDEPSLRALFVGIHLAGEKLTPETFRDGLFRSPPSAGLSVQAGLSWGDHGVWPEVDYGGTDDIALLWWDPDATGPDELGQEGTGMYRYAYNGRRYQLADLPASAEEARLFDDESSVTVYEHIPFGERPPDYPTPQL